MRYVAGIGTDTPPPDLILLDLHLPKADGYEILNAIRLRPGCAETPAVILTSSESPRDRERAVQLGVKRYFVKPADLDEFLKFGAAVQEVMAKGC